MSEYWPTVIPLPVDATARERLLFSLFSSPVTVEVLRLIEPGVKVYQRDLVNRLRHHSNKTVLAALRRLAEAGLLEEGFERVRSGARDVWLKYYRLTDLGAWFQLMLREPSQLSGEELRGLALRLFSELSRRIAGSRDLFHVKAYDLVREVVASSMEALVAESRAKAGGFDVAVLGSVAVDVFMKAVDGVARVVLRSPGGSGSNVAVDLARLGRSVCFIGRVACDPYGLWCLEDMVEEGVSVAGVVLDRSARTVEVVVELLDGSSRLRCLIEECSALSPLPGEVDLGLVERSKAVYVGEVFNEVAEEVLDVACRSGVDAYYRPLEYALETRFEATMNPVRRGPVLILNEAKWRVVSSRGFEDPRELLEMGASTVIITLGEAGALLVEDEDAYLVRAPRIRPIDMTGAGDCFAATLIDRRLRGMSTLDSVRHAVAASSLSTQGVGGRARVPSDKVFKGVLERVAVRRLSGEEVVEELRRITGA